VVAERVTGARRRPAQVDSRVNACGILVVDFKSIAARRSP
jgi:hypothetical protein